MGWGYLGFGVLVSISCLYYAALQLLLDKCQTDRADGREDSPHTVIQHVNQQTTLKSNHTQFSEYFTPVL